MRDNDNTSRRQLLKYGGIGAATMAGFAGCLGGGGGDSGKEEIADTLNIFSFYPEYLPAMANEFAKKHDLTTHITGYSSNQEAYTKLKAAGTSNVDFAVNSNNMITRFRKEEMIQPINTEWLESWETMKSVAANAPWENFLKANGEYWGVPFTRGLFMNVARQSKVENGTIPADLANSWDIYFEDTDARLGIRDYGRRNVSIVIWHLRGAKGDINKDPGNAVSWDTIESKLVEMIQNAKTIYTSSETARKMIKQDQIDMANVWGGDVIQLKQLSNVEDAKGYMPKEGTNGWFDAFLVPKGAKHAYTSHKFMDFALQPQNLVKEFELEGNVAVRPNIVEELSTAQQEKFRFLLEIDPQKLQPYAYDPDLANKANKAWNRAKSKAA